MKGILFTFYALLVVAFVVIISLSVGNKQFHELTIVNKISISDVYKTNGVDKNKVIINSPRFKVVCSTPDVKPGNSIKFEINGLKDPSTTAKIDTTTFSNEEIYAIGELNTADNYAQIPNWKTINNQIKAYVFIKPEGENMTYEYDLILKEKP